MASKTKAMCLTAMFAVLMMLGAWIAVPTVPPFTMQTFVLYCMVCLLDGKKMLGAVAIYMFLGVVGLPVFAGFQGGVGVLFSGSGGYLVGFLGMALLRFIKPTRSTLWSVVLMIVGTLLSYVCAVLWYAVLFTGLSLAGVAAATATCVLPFIIPDFVKGVAAVLVSKRLKRFVE